jgi:hypothetical protein
MAISAAALAAGSVRVAAAAAPYVLPCGASYLLGNRNAKNTAPTFSSTYNPQLTPQFTTENIADQRNTPNFQQELHVYLGANETIRLSHQAPTMTDGARMSAKTSAITPDSTPRIYALDSQSRGSGRLPSPAKVISLATIGGGIWAIFKIRSINQRAHKAQEEGWCTWKTANLSTEQLALSGASEVVPELIQHAEEKFITKTGGNTAQATRLLLSSLNEEIDQLQSYMSLAHRLTSLRIGFLCGITQDEIAHAQNALNRTRILKQKAVMWLLHHQS